MKVGISNIAWNPDDDDKVASILLRHGVDAIDVAPSKYFPNPGRATSADVRRVRDIWMDRGFEIIGMQALMFGTAGLNMFGPLSSQEAMLGHLAEICRIGSGLGAQRLVFGSPKNRDRSGLSDDDALRQGVQFFDRLARIASSHGVVICLEPNPSAYGANFMTTSSETARVVREVDHPSIRMQLDTGSLAINSENITEVLAQFSDLIGHIHASEPHLVPLGTGGTDHAAIAAALRVALPMHTVTIEMLTEKGRAHLQAIERAVDIATCHYRAESCGQPGAG